MDGLLEKFVPGGYRGVQLTAYSWELADRVLEVHGGQVSAGGEKALTIVCGDEIVRGEIPQPMEPSSAAVSATAASRFVRQTL